MPSSTRMGYLNSCVTVPISGCFATNNNESLRDAALNHLSVALLPDFSAQTDLREGTLFRVLEDWQLKGAFSDEIHLIRPYSRHVTRAVMALVTYLREHLEEGLSPAASEL